MINVRDVLFDISDNNIVYEEDKEIDLFDEGILDSFGVIELFSRLEDEGIELQITRIDRSKLKTIKGIEELIKENSVENN